MLIFFKLKSCESSGWFFDLTSSFPVTQRLGWLWIGTLNKCTPLTPVFLKVRFLVLRFSHYALMIFLMKPSNLATYVDDTILYFKYDQASDLRQQLELAFELESDLYDTVDWSKKCHVDFQCLKNLTCFIRPFELLLGLSFSSWLNRSYC